MTFFSNLGAGAWVDVTSNKISDRVTAQEIQTTSGVARATLVVAAHLDSANYLDESDRAEWARFVAADIRELERDLGHRRTVLVGDLNMNPFDGGLLQTTALQAVMSRGLARSVAGLTSRKSYPALVPATALRGPTTSPTRPPWQVASGRCTIRCCCGWN